MAVDLPEQQADDQSLDSFRDRSGSPLTMDANDHHMELDDGGPQEAIQGSVDGVEERVGEGTENEEKLSEESEDERGPRIGYEDALGEDGEEFDMADLALSEVGKDWEGSGDDEEAEEEQEDMELAGEEGDEEAEEDEDEEDEEDFRQTRLSGPAEHQILSRGRLSACNWLLLMKSILHYLSVCSDELDEDEWRCVRAFAYNVATSIGHSNWETLKFIFPEFELPSRRDASQRIRALSGIKPVLIDCCPKSCMAFTGDFRDDQKCSHCNSNRYTSAGTPRLRFQYIPLTPMLQALYAGRVSAKAMRYRSRHDADSPPGHIRDVYDCEIYKKLRRRKVRINEETLPFRYFSDPREVLVGIGTDGFNFFKRGSYTAWPLLLINYNLPPDERCHDDNVICCGIIPGPRKPKDYDTFWLPWVEEMQQLAEGVDTYDALDDEVFPLRAHAAFGLGDIPGVAKGFLKMKGHNAFNPCRDCSMTAVAMRGVAVNGKRNRIHYVPLVQPPDMPEALTFDPRNLPLRTHTEFLRQAKEVEAAQTQAASDALAKRYGICGVPILSSLQSLSFPHSFPYDFMHLMENIMENLIKLWTGEFKGLDAGSEDYIIPEKEWEAVGLATFACKAHIPSSFGRALPNIAEDRSFFIAESYIVWFTLLAPILLRGRFKHEKYYVHMCDFVSLVNRTMSFDITLDELDDLEEGWIRWYEDYERYVH